MRRRDFIGASAGTAALITGTTGCRKANKSVTDDGMLAGLTLDQLIKQYRYDLFDDFMPFLEKYVVDHEYGGFMCRTDRDGTNLDTNKRAWFEGRGIWVYSFLYRNVKNDPKYLEIARKSVDFVLNIKPSGEDFWPASFSREGTPLTTDKIFYGDIFIANGLQEYSRASGEEHYWKMAKDILIKCMNIYDNRLDYCSIPKSEPKDKPEVPGVVRPRILGHWMVLLRLTTQMLEMKNDPEIEAINSRSVEAVMNYHYNPTYGLINEHINHDLTRIENDNGESVTGHAPETLWMVLFEAARRKDRQLFDKAAEHFRRHIEVLWDDVYGGLMGGLTNVDRNEWTTGKYLWLQEEILVGTLFVIEHTGAQWAKDWFSRMFTYVHDKFPLKQYGFPIWILYADRKVTFVEHTTRVGNFHHPRHLMLNLLCLERMKERNGRVSKLFS